MTNNELIKELVTYDGYTYRKTITGGYFVIDNYENGGKEFVFTFIDLYAYLTDMNILHMLAVKVTEQLKEMYSDDSHDTSFDFEHDMKVTEVKSSIVSAMFTSPNPQGEHLQLAEALVNAIRYISANKAG